MKKIKLLTVAMFTVLLAVSCGPSEAEKEQAMFDADVQSMCDCFEANKGDWLTYRQEGAKKVNMVRATWKNFPERLVVLEEKIAECDKYHKDN